MPVPVSRFMDTVQTALRNHFMCDFRAAHKCARAGNVANTLTAFLYDQFREFCATFRI